MGASAKVVHEPEHSIPAYYSHGSKFLPIHRGFAPDGLKTARQYKLNIFSNKPYNLIWEHG